MDPSKKKQSLLSDKSVYFIGFYYLLVLTSLILISSLLFFLKIPITIFHLLLSIVAAAVILLYLNKCDKRAVSVSILIALVLFAALTAFSSVIFDISCDGNTYHKTAIGFLKNGWNPVYQSSQAFNDTNHIIPDNPPSIWIDHYTKGPWVLSAAVYILTNSIETGKVISWLMMIVLFCISYDYLNKRFLKNWQSLIAAFFITFNPITCAQLTTLYIDGLLCITLYTGIFFLISITDINYSINKPEKWLGLFCTIVICSNIKFTGLAFIGLVSIVFYIYWIIQNRKNKDFSRYCIRVTAFFAASVIISVGMVGYSSYIKNIFENGNPFYPLFGKGAVDIITPYAPLQFKNHSGIYNWLLSIFSVTTNEFQIQTMQYKMPFTVLKSEIDAIHVVDMRIGGFGLLFSGIFLISIVILIFCFVHLLKKDKKVLIVSCLVLLSLFISLLALKESWWARYNPLTYSIPLLALILLLHYSNSHAIIYKGAAAIFAAILFINLGFFAYFRLKDMKHSFATVSEMNELKKYAADKIVTVYCPTGLLFNLKDLGVQYNYVQTLDQSFKGIDCNSIFYK